MRYPDARSSMLAEFAYPVLDRVDPAEEFHEASKYSASTVASEWHPARDYFLRYHDGHARVGRSTLVHHGERVDLPAPAELPVELSALVRRRRSRLAPGGRLGLGELGTVLGLAYGADEHRDYRTCPSAGALYPFDLIVVPARVDGLEPAVHVYDPFEHCLWRGPHTDPARFVAGATVAGEVPDPSVVIGLAATFARNRAKYGLRGYRFALLEAGHIAQTALLVATALGIDSQPWGGFADRYVDRAFELDGTFQSCLYLLCLGGARD